jgi:hypothetical protein
MRPRDDSTLSALREATERVLSPVPDIAPAALAQYRNQATASKAAARRPEPSGEQADRIARALQGLRRGDREWVVPLARHEGALAFKVARLMGATQEEAVEVAARAVCIAAGCDESMHDPRAFESRVVAEAVRATAGDARSAYGPLAKMTDTLREALAVHLATGMGGERLAATLGCSEWAAMERLRAGVRIAGMMNTKQYSAAQ